MDKDKLILLTNDDGIDSPGLYAAAAALSELGWVLVAAPREQQSASGRSMPRHSDGIINVRHQTIKDERWEMYAVGGTPAQVVQHALFEIIERKPDLVVSGINYGENVGNGVTISGTVGAALEGASHGIPSIAVSLETKSEHHRSHSTEVDFSAAAYFTSLFAKRLLTAARPPDMDVLKIDVPAAATPATPWRLVRQSRQRYYDPIKPTRDSYDEPGSMSYRRNINADTLDHDGDIYAMVYEQVVAVTPLSLDMTARIDFAAYESILRAS